jgi:putative aldouronate transport system substrate-binding protein
MKKRMFVLSALLIVIIAATGFAAGGTAKSGSSEPADYGKRTTGRNYWFVKYDQPVTVRIVDPEYLEDIEPGQDVTNNEWIWALKRDLNVDVIHDWVSPTAEYSTRINLSIASGQLPDWFQVSNSQFDQLVEADMIADLTNYVENNLSDTVKEIMNYAPEVTETAKINGKLLGLPKYGYGAVSGFTLMWIRHDWLKNRNGPKTLTELENMMKAFMSEHPGSYGIAMDKSLLRLTQLGPSFKAYPATWVTVPDGTIAYGGIQPEVKTMLQTWADWYKKGYLRADFTSMNNDAIREDIISGKVGIDSGLNHWGYAYAQDLVKNWGDQAYYDAFDLPTADGKPAINSAPFDNSGYIVANKKYNNLSVPLKCLSYVEYMSLDAVTQKEKTMDELKPYLRNGNFNQCLKPFFFNDPRMEIIAYEKIQEAARTGNTSIFVTPNMLAKYESSRTWEVDRNPNGVGTWSQVYGPRAGYSVCTPIFKEKRFISDRLNGPAPAELAQYGSTLGDILIEGYTKIIVGQQPLSYFDTLVREWRTAGGDTVTAAVNKAYGKK